MLKKTKSGMKREDKGGKLNYLDYVSVGAMKRYAIHMKKGELVHGRGNWKKGGYPKHEYLESLMRHLMLLVENNEKGQKRRPQDEDHAAAIMFNIIGYLTEEERNK